MSQSLSDIAYDHILELIFSRKLTDGSKIDEQVIMSTLNISRTPVREAIQRLVSDSILDHYPRQYTQVHTFTRQDIFDLATLRISIDSLAVQLAILNGSNLSFQRLGTLAKQCDDASAAADIEARILADAEFHMELIRIGGNQILLDVQKRLSLKTRLLQTQTYNRYQSLSCNLDGHQKILNALNARDVETALRAVDEHLRPHYAKMLSQEGDSLYTLENLHVKSPHFNFSDIHT